VEGDVGELGFCLITSIYTVGAKLRKVLEELFGVVSLVDNLGAQVQLLFLRCHGIINFVNGLDKPAQDLRETTIQT